MGQIAASSQRGLWLTNLEPDSQAILLPHSDNAMPDGFISNTEYRYYSYAENLTFVYNIATGDVQDTPLNLDEFPQPLPSLSMSASGIQFQGSINSNGNVNFAGSGTTVVQLGNAGVIPSPDTNSTATVQPTGNSLYELHSTVEDDNVRIVIYNTETGEQTLLFDQSQYLIREVAWDDSGTEFAFVATILGAARLEGEIWIYSLEEGEATPSNEIGRNLLWLR